MPAADGGHPPMWRDPVVAAITAAMTLVLGWYLFGGGTHRAQVLVCWFVMPVLDVALAVLSWRASRLPGNARPARRFWRTLTIAGCLFFFADGYQAVVTVLDPGADDLSQTVVQSGASLVGAAMLLVVGAAYPTGTLTRAARLRFWLDGAILNSAAVVVAWCLLTRPALNHVGPEAFVTAVVGSALVLSGVYIAVRMGLSGSSPMTVHGALPLIAAASSQGIANLLIPAASPTDHLTLHLVMLLFPCLVALYSPRLQELLEGRDRAVRSPRVVKRRYSLLPYAATLIAAATLVVILATAGLGLSAWGAVVGLLVNVALVVGRQINALAENGTLLDRLDVSLAEARELQDRLRYQAGHDELTGLANRREFTERMSAAAPGEVAVLLIDLDGFKQINDTYGHAAGDAVLVHVAGRLRDCAGPDDVPARLGGDEFALLLGRPDRAAAEKAAARFREALAAPASIRGELLTVGASVGVAVGAVSDPDHLLHEADLRMYAQKQRARTVRV